jgi:hypothetical protein
MDTFKVGSNIDAWCTKCKLILAHTIDAIASGVIKRVQCNTCKGTHQFKSNEPGAKKISPVLKTKALSKNKSKASDYSKLLEGKNLAHALSYSSFHQFVKGDVINHSKFGLGVVVEAKDISKIEVLFESGPKILIHARI